MFGRFQIERAGFVSEGLGHVEAPWDEVPCGLHRRCLRHRADPNGQIFRASKSTGDRLFFQIVDFRRYAASADVRLRHLCSSVKASLFTPCCCAGSNGQTTISGCCDVWRHPEMVVDGITDLLFEPNSAERLADAIEILLLNPVQGIEMGHAGKRRIASTFSLKRRIAAINR